MREKLVALREKIGFIGVLRIYGAAILMFMLYWIISDIELNFFDMMCVPMLYYFERFGYFTKKVTILFIPIIFNIAIWKKSYRNYIIFRSILTMELMRMIFFIPLFILLLILSVCAGEGLKYFYLFFVPMFLIMIFYTISVYKISKIKAVKNEFINEEKEIKNDIIKAMFIIYGFLSVLTFAEVKIDDFTAKPNMQTYKLNDNRYCEAISPNGKYLLVSSNTNQLKRNVYFYDAETKNEIKMLFSNIFFDTDHYITPDSKNVISIERDKDDKINVKMFNVENGEQDKRVSYFEEFNSMNDKRLLGPFFNPSGKKIIIINELNMKIWNYDTDESYIVEKKIKSLNKLAWISEDEFVICSDETMGKMDNEFGLEEVYLYKFDGKGSVRYEKKDKIAEDIEMKKGGLVNSSISIEALGDQKRIAIMISGKSKLLESERSFIDIWDVKSEEKIISKKYYSLIDEILYSKNKNVIIIYERKANGKDKMRTLNPENGDLKKKLAIPYLNVMEPLKFDNNRHPVLVENGDKIVMKGNFVRIIDLK